MNRQFENWKDIKLYMDRNFIISMDINILSNTFLLDEVRSIYT